MERNNYKNAATVSAAVAHVAVQLKHSISITHDISIFQKSKWA